MFLPRLNYIKSLTMNNVNESGFDILFELYEQVYRIESKQQMFTIKVIISCLDIVFLESSNSYAGTLEDFIKGYLEDGSDIQRARDNIARISKRIGLIE